MNDNYNLGREIITDTRNLTPQKGIKSNRHVLGEVFATPSPA
jgi:hypothetical protein